MNVFLVEWRWRVIKKGEWRLAAPLFYGIAVVLLAEKIQGRTRLEPVNLLIIQGVVQADLIR
jgi:hypothetical protein